MALSYYEKFESGDGTSVDGTGDTLIYIVTGTAADNVGDAIVAANYALGVIPTTYNGNNLKSIERKRTTDKHWEFTAKYVAPGTDSFRPTGEKAFTFTTAGGTQHITQALSHIATYDDGGSISTDQDGAINATPTGIEGVDIDVSAFDFQITSYISAGDLDASYVTLLYQLTNTVNASTFTATVDGVSFTFNEGECRFRGAQGSKRGIGDWEITKNFSASPNVTGRTIGPISGIAKKGWEYISVYYEQTDDATNKVVVQKPKFVFVDQVYPEDNWTGLVPS